MPEPAPTGKPRICTVADDIEAVLLLAEYLAVLPQEVQRTDIEMAAALDFFRAHHDAPDAADFDLVVIAPRVVPGAAFRMAEAVLAAAAGAARARVVLVPRGTRLPAAIRNSGATIIQGPPFKGPVPLPPPGAPNSGRAVPGQSPGQSAGQSRGAPGQKPSLLGRLLRRPPSGSGPGTRSGARPGASDAGEISGPEPRDPPEIRMIAVQGMSGGVGATTIAVNLAVELARLRPKNAEGAAADVCLLDFNLQFGNAAAYLNLPVSAKIPDAYRNIRGLDALAFRECLGTPEDGLHVFAAPDEILPFDALNGDAVERLLLRAQEIARFVIVDLPHAVADWSEKVYIECDRVLCISTLDIRSSQNARRLNRLLRGNSMPGENFAHCLNLAPARKPGDWHENRRNMEKGIGTGFSQIFTDGGEDVGYSGNLGAPLAAVHPENVFRKELRAMAQSLTENARRMAPADATGADAAGEEG